MSVFFPAYLINATTTTSTTNNAPISVARGPINPELEILDITES